MSTVKGILKRSVSNSVAFTGYRPSKLGIANRGENLETDIVEAAKVAIKRFYDTGSMYFLCGMAEGFDLLAAQALFKLQESGDCRDAHIVAVVPFDGFQLSFTEYYKSLYAKTLACACETIVIAPHYIRGCYNQRNDYLTDNASAVICYYDGKPGGTAYTVNRSRKKGLQIYNILNPSLILYR